MKEQEVKIHLTGNTLENIRIMAPLLDEASQNQVFGIMLGLVKGMDRIQTATERAG